MKKVKNNLNFRFMALSYKFRDIFRSRINILKNVNIKAGSYILDYGCGPGSYILPLEALVGKAGQIYALDINPVAISMVRNLALRKRLDNVQTIHSDCKTGLSDNDLDVVLLYDILHHLNNSNEVLAELSRVLKTDGILSVSDHHMKEKEIVKKVYESGLFKLSEKAEGIYNFSKEE